MGKKRKVSGRAPQATGPKELDPADSRIGPISTWEDVADSEDEYFMNQDKIMLEDEPKSKRQKRIDQEEEFFEPSDEEVLSFDEDSDDDEDHEDIARKSKAPKGVKKAAGNESSEEEGGGGEEEGDEGWWGSSKGEYYNADNIETEADAVEEENEARRLQEKKFSKMADADFGFDEDEWLAPAADAEDDQAVVTEVLKDVEITDDMSPDERYRLIKARYPEFDYLAEEFQQLQPQLPVFQGAAEGKPGQSIEVIQYWVLGSYVAALASYFAILTSPARDDDGSSKKLLDPAELRDHDVMDALLGCREMWLKVKDMKSSKPGVEPLSPPEDDDDMLRSEENLAEIVQTKTKKTKDKSDVRAREKSSLKAKKNKKNKKATEVEDDLADLSSLLKKTKGSKKIVASNGVAQDEGHHSDFGEDEMIDARTAADKAARKKSLKFYTSQIVQKANRRGAAGRDAGGDMDLPHRERLRDRQARLMKEAERRGARDSKFGADLGQGSDEEDGGNGGDSDEYYDMVNSASKKKKAERAAKHEALAAASKLDRVVENEEVGPDGKRKITYAIEKNRGLTPRRKKENRNPRVKRRVAYKQKQIKLKSMKPVWAGGEGRGGYQGEKTGIKPGLITSTKL